MKPLFVDIITKMTPDLICNNEIHYTIKDREKQLFIDITWLYVKPGNVPKLEFKFPFSVPFDDYRWYPSTDYSQKVYTLRINSCTYWLDFNPVEICEVDRLIYNVFSNYQSDNIKQVQDFINADTQADPKTTEQKFEEAQEAVVDNE